MRLERDMYNRLSLSAVELADNRSKLVDKEILKVLWECSDSIPFVEALLHSSHH